MAVDTTASDAGAAQKLPDFVRIETAIDFQQQRQRQVAAGAGLQGKHWPTSVLKFCWVIFLINEGRSSPLLRVKMVKIVKAIAAVFAQQLGVVVQDGHALWPAAGLQAQIVGKQHAGHHLGGADGVVAGQRIGSADVQPGQQQIAHRTVSSIMACISKMSACSN